MVKVTRRKILTITCIAVSFLANGQSIYERFATDFTKYTVSTKTCTKLVHFTGSLIFIPDHAFDVDPQQIDSVDIYYREMRNPLDMIIHEVPMVTELMGRKFFLESNGMFEIWAMSGQDTIAIHEDRSIEVRLAMKPSQVDVRMEGYEFDAAKGLWESYTNRIGNVSVNDADEDLWGSSPVENTFTMQDGETVMSTADTVRKRAFQAMEIYDFGFYNYDKIIQGEEFVPVKGNFITSSGREIVSKIYVVYKDLNSVFYYFPEQWESGFALIKDRNYKLFAISDQGNVASLEEYPELSGIANKQHTFVLDWENEVPQNRTELAKMTGL